MKVFGANMNKSTLTAEKLEGILQFFKDNPDKGTAEVVFGGFNKEGIGTCTLVVKPNPPLEIKKLVVKVKKSL